jgi:VanZ family protein
MRDWRVKGEALSVMILRPPPRTAWLLVALWAAAILAFSITPEMPGRGVVPDKVAHIVAYAVLGLLLRWALPASSVGFPAVATVLAAVAYGALLEGLQGLTGRDAEWWDLGANTLGAVVGVLVGGWRAG